jgi:hypothetical protein
MSGTRQQRYSPSSDRAGSDRFVLEVSRRDQTGGQEEAVLFGPFCVLPYARLLECDGSPIPIGGRAFRDAPIPHLLGRRHHTITKIWKRSLAISSAEKRLGEYSNASAALGNLLTLGDLADEQVNHLRRALRTEAASWRSRIYLGAFPDTAHELVDTGMGRKGELDLVVETGGVSAPAQHVTNASALRASLVGFYLAFWEYVLKERGGLATLILDDPQELLDDENRERLASALVPVMTAGAQLIVTSYDPRFCARVARLRVAGGIEHLEVHPATRQQPFVRTTPPLPVVEQRKARFDADKNAEEPARDFADGCRVFLEAKLGDMFDDPAYSAWASAHPDPTLATFVHRLRPLTKAGLQGMFSAHVFRRFVDHPALLDGSPVLALMNKATTAGAKRSGPLR